MIDVVAALIWNQEGKFLAFQRPSHKARGLLWEFVGGKVEPGESRPAALIRECKEELDVAIAVDDIFMDVVHEYPDITVHLWVFNARISEGSPKLLEHNAIHWMSVDEMDSYIFCPADKDILTAIKRLK